MSSEFFISLGYFLACVEMTGFRALPSRRKENFPHLVSILYFSYIEVVLEAVFELKGMSPEVLRLLFLLQIPRKKHFPHFILISLVFRNYGSFQTQI